MAKKLSPAMQELLDAMKGGVRVLFVSGPESYYFRNDTHKHVWSTVKALVDRGLVREVCDSHGRLNRAEVIDHGQD